MENYLDATPQEYIHRLKSVKKLSLELLKELPKTIQKIDEDIAHWTKVIAQGKKKEKRVK